MSKRQGHEGWDEYAPFYDWENAQTQGRRDIPFWRRLAVAADGPVLELGSGTGRILLPLARAGAVMIGVDRSAAMLVRARRRAKRSIARTRIHLSRGDIRTLPFAESTFPLVIAPYGVLQSLLRERDLAATLRSVADVLQPGGLFGLELVADLASWPEYRRKVSLRGTRRRGAARVSLIESVQHDRRRGWTVFDQEFRERRGATVASRTFRLTFRPLSVRQMIRRLRAAGFEVAAVLGDYQGGPWDARAEAWILLAKKQGSRDQGTAEEPESIPDP